MNMDDLLKALNQAQAGQGAGGGQPDLGSLLGALGGGQQGGGQPDLGSLLGALGGGSGQAGSDPLAGLLGGLLGGGQAGAGLAAGSGSPLNALIRPFAEKLGLSPEVAGLVVSFLMNALLSGQMAGRSSAATAPAPGMDLGQAIAGFGGRQASRSSAANTALVQQLSQQTGLDEQTAARSIDEFVNLLGGQQGIDRLLGAG